MNESIQNKEDKDLDTNKPLKIPNSKSIVLDKNRSSISLESIEVQESSRNDHHNKSISESDSYFEERKSISRSSEHSNSSFTFKSEEVLFEDDVKPATQQIPNISNNEEKKKKQKEEENEKRIATELALLKLEQAKQKQALASGMSRCTVEAVEFDWIFNDDYGKEFLVTLSEIEDISIFSVEIIKNIVMFMWRYYRKAIAVWIMIPFLFYFITYIIYATWIK